MKKQLTQEEKLLAAKAKSQAIAAAFDVGCET